MQFLIYGILIHCLIYTGIANTMFRIFLQTQILCIIFSNVMKIVYFIKTKCTDSLIKIDGVSNGGIDTVVF